MLQVCYALALTLLFNITNALAYYTIEFCYCVKKIIVGARQRQVGIVVFSHLLSDDWIRTPDLMVSGRVFYR